MKYSNKEIEDRAMKVVRQFERENGRISRDVRTRGVGYGVDSGGRKIEVKGTTTCLDAPGQWRYITQATFQMLLRERDSYVYVVDRLGDDLEKSTVYVLHRDDVLANMSVKPETSYTLSLPKAVQAKAKQHWRFVPDSTQ